MTFLFDPATHRVAPRPHAPFTPAPPAEIGLRHWEPCAVSAAGRSPVAAPPAAGPTPVDPLDAVFAYGAADLALCGGR